MLVLTRNIAQVEKAYTLACFNVFAHNRDDHSKNFSFLLDDKNSWVFAPAYDLTFSPGPGGEHTMTVLGEGREPTREQCLALASRVGIRPPEVELICDEVNSAVSRWRVFADEAGCAKRVSARILSAIRRI